MTAYSDYLDFYSHGPQAAELKECRLAGTAPVRLFDVEHQPGEISNSPMPELLICLGVRVQTQLDVDVGAGRWQGLFRSGDILLAAAGTSTRYRPESPARNLTLTLTTSALATALEDHASAFRGDFGRLHSAPFRDVFVETLCRRLWDEAAAGNPYGSLFADGAVLALGAALLRLADRPVAKPCSTAGQVSLKRLRRALDMLEERLAEDLALADLADAAALSPRHLMRVFQVHTGMTPHAYLQRRRIEHAKILLSSTDLALVEVALACGFKGQSHFGQAFRRVVGATPRAYRRECRS